MHSDHEVNRASWDELAAAHGQDAYYDSEALVAGASSLIEEEEAALADAIGADLVGRRVLHLVVGTLAQGGRLVLIDGHPLGRVLKSDPLRMARPYVGTTRRPTDPGWDYATTTRTGTQVQFLHSLGEIVTAAADAGLRVTRLLEHTDASCGLCIPHLELEDDGRYRHRADGHPLPVLFTLIARR